MPNPRWWQMECVPYFFVGFPGSLRPAMRAVVEALVEEGVGRMFSLRKDPPAGSIRVLVKPVSEYAMDLPGMMATGRPWEKIQIPGLVFETPSQDVGAILENLRGLEPIERFGRTWYELPGFHRSLVLGLSHRRALDAAMAAALPSARARAEAFEAAHAERYPGSAELARGMRAGTHGLSGGAVVPLPRSMRPN